VLIISMKRFSGVLRKEMETPCKRSIWGAMICKDEGGRMRTNQAGEHRDDFVARRMGG